MIKQKKTHAGVAAVLAVMMMASLFAWHSKEKLERRWLYPWPFEETVFYYAHKNGVDPYLVASVINNESRFRAAAKSNRGAVGLMQLMPETATWIAKEMGVGPLAGEELVNPDTNIRLGCWYLSELLHEFQGNEVLALAAYNAGRGTVRQWMKENNWDASFQSVQDIPYQETRAYVGRVLVDQGKYKSLYLWADGSEKINKKRG